MVESLRDGSIDDSEDDFNCCGVFWLGFLCGFFFGIISAFVIRSIYIVYEGDVSDRTHVFYQGSNIGLLIHLAIAVTCIIVFRDELGRIL